MIHFTLKQILKMSGKWFSRSAYFSLLTIKGGKDDLFSYITLKLSKINLSLCVQLLHMLFKIFTSVCAKNYLC